MGRRSLPAVSREAASKDESSAAQRAGGPDMAGAGHAGTRILLADFLGGLSFVVRVNLQQLERRFASRSIPSQRSLRPALTRADLILRRLMRQRAFRSSVGTPRATRHCMSRGLARDVTSNGERPPYSVSHEASALRTPSSGSLSR